MVRIRVRSYNQPKTYHTYLVAAGSAGEYRRVLPRSLSCSSRLEVVAVVVGRGGSRAHSAIRTRTVIL